MLKSRTCAALVANTIQNTSRLNKIVAHLEEQKMFSGIDILGFWELGLPIEESRTDNIKVRRLKPLHKKYRVGKGFLNKVFLVFSLIHYFFFFLVYVAKKKYSIILCHDVMMLPIAFWAKKIGGAKFIYLPHELETEETGLNLFNKYLYRIFEHLFIKDALGVIVVSHEIKIWYEDKYNLKDVRVIRNIPLKSSGIIQKRLRSSLNIGINDVVYIYQGLLDYSRGANDLLEVAINIGDPRIHFVFMGFGPAVNEITEVSKHHNNIHYIPAVPSSEIINYTSDADIGIFFVSDMQLSLSYKYSLGNKIFEYINSGIPVLSTKNLVSTSQEILKNNFGWSIEPNKADLTKFILTIDKVELLAKKQSVITSASQYDWNIEVSHLSNILKQNINAA